MAFEIYVLPYERTVSDKKVVFLCQKRILTLWSMTFKTLFALRTGYCVYTLWEKPIYSTRCSFCIGTTVYGRWRKYFILFFLVFMLKNWKCTPNSMSQNTDGNNILHTLLVKHYNNYLDIWSCRRGRGVFIYL